MAMRHQDLVGRPIPAESAGATADGTVGALAVLAKERGFMFVLRAGILTALTEDRGGELVCRIALFGDLVEGASGGIVTIRAEGETPAPDADLREGFRWGAHD
jgi:hypothetical protein